MAGEFDGFCAGIFGAGGNYEAMLCELISVRCASP